MYLVCRLLPPRATYTLSLPDALPICHVLRARRRSRRHRVGRRQPRASRLVQELERRSQRDGRGEGQKIPSPRRSRHGRGARQALARGQDRKSTRLNSSHRCISYAVFCRRARPTLFPYPTLFRSVMFFEHGGDRVVIASAGGSPAHPAWYKNLSGDPNVTVEVKGKKYRARAEVATGEARAKLWQEVKIGRAHV